MPRPRNIMPAVRQRRRKTFIELRVWFGDRWHPVGKVGDSPAEVRERVMAVVAGEATKPKPIVLPRPQGLTISKLFTSYLRHDDAPKDPGDRAMIRRSGFLLVQFCGAESLAAGLNALLFEDWRDWLCRKKASVWRGKSKGNTDLDKTLSREYVIKLMRAARRTYRWGAKRELLPKSVAADLANASLPQSSKSRLSTAPTPVTPQDAADVVPHLYPVVRDMLAIQKVTGARPSEIWRMRPAEVHRAGFVAVGKTLVDLDSPVMAGCWLYLPRKHKTENSKHHRAIPIPQSIQAVLRPYLDRDAESYCFSPREQEQRRGRPLRSGARAFRDHFDTQSYTRSIQNACRRANIKPWTANQIRHLGIFEMAASHGARAAMLFAGHSNLTTTSRYLAFDAATLFGAVKDR